MLQLLVILVVCSTAFAQRYNYTHNDILAAVDHTFGTVDTNQNSMLEVYELLESYDRRDTNHDHRVTEQEYTQGAHYRQFFGIVFLQLDTDKDGYLDRSAELGEFAVMDTTGDNVVSRTEYDEYFAGVVEKAVANYGYLLAGRPTASTVGPTTT